MFNITDIMSIMLDVVHLVTESASQDHYWTLIAQEKLCVPRGQFWARAKSRSPWSLRHVVHHQQRFFDFLVFLPVLLIMSLGKKRLRLAEITEDGIPSSWACISYSLPPVRRTCYKFAQTLMLYTMTLQNQHYLSRGGGGILNIASTNPISKNIHS